MRMTFGILALVAAAGSASAADTLVTATLLNSAPVDSATQAQRWYPAASIASNDFTGSTSNGGSAVQAGNTIARLNADDIHMTSAITNLTKFVQLREDLNAVAVSARPRVRFYAADGRLGLARSSPASLQPDHGQRKLGQPVLHDQPRHRGPRTSGPA